MECTKIEINKNINEQSILSGNTMASSTLINDTSLMNNSKELSQNTIILEKAEISPEIKEQIEKMVDDQFEEEYKKINAEYDKKIEELINEREEICNKNEMIKSKYEALEEYLRNYCKRMNIDYDSLVKEWISNNENNIKNKDEFFSLYLVYK